MTFIERSDPVRCEVGLHAYAPDTDAGYPYLQCARCEKLRIYRPPPLARLRLRALLR